ncbi:MAG: electron transport complex subunit RsxE [Fusobacteriaceae bacterium]
MANESSSYGKTLIAGIIKDNPTFVLMLGLCPTLGTTNSAVNGMSMGLATLVVLALSNLLISAFRKVIPDKVRIPAYIMIIATLVTTVQLLMQAYLPEIYSVLGIFIPLIVVNCIVLGRAESFASKNGVGLSVFDGIGSGLGFTLSLTLIGAVREVLGNGTFFNISFVPANYTPALIFILAPGAFITIGCLMGYMNHVKAKREAK